MDKGTVEDVKILTNVIGSIRLSGVKDYLVREVTKANYLSKASVEYIMQSGTVAAPVQKI